MAHLCSCSPRAAASFRFRCAWESPYSAVSLTATSLNMIVSTTLSFGSYKECRQNPKEKRYVEIPKETGEFNTAFKLLPRLRQRYIQWMISLWAAHIFQYYALKQKESESDADFVDREMRVYLALRDMRINVDDSIRLTKFVGQDTINSSRK